MQEASRRTDVLEDRCGDAVRELVATGAVLYTEDHGQTWTAQSSGTTNTLYAINYPGLCAPRTIRARGAHYSRSS